MGLGQTGIHPKANLCGEPLHLHLHYTLSFTSIHLALHFHLHFTCISTSLTVHLHLHLHFTCTSLAFHFTFTSLSLSLHFTSLSLSGHLHFQVCRSGECWWHTQWFVVCGTFLGVSCRDSVVGRRTSIVSVVAMERHECMQKLHLSTLQHYSVEVLYESTLMEYSTEVL